MESVTKKNAKKLLKRVGIGIFVVIVLLFTMIAPLLLPKFANAIGVELLRDVKKDYGLKFDGMDYLAFAGSILSGVIGGTITIVGIHWTLKEQRGIFEEQREHDKRLLEEVRMRRNKRWEFHYSPYSECLNSIDRHFTSAITFFQERGEKLKDEHKKQRIQRLKEVIARELGGLSPFKDSLKTELSVLHDMFYGSFVIEYHEELDDLIDGKSSILIEIDGVLQEDFVFTNELLVDNLDLMRSHYESFRLRWELNISNLNEL